MKKFLVAMFVGLFALATTAYGAELIMTDFSVDGSVVSVKGVVSGTENARASIFVTANGGGVYTSQAEADENGAFDLSFSVPSNWSGKYVANIGATDSKAKIVEFTYPGDKSYISYTPEQVTEDETSDNIKVDSVKRVSRVTVSGKVTNSKSDDKSVVLVVRKADAVAVSESDVAYMDQTVLDDEGSFAFEFNFVGDLSQYKAYLYANGENISDSILVSESQYDYVTAELSLSQLYNKAILLAKMKNEYDDKLPYILILTMYDKNNVMIGMKTEEAVVNSMSSADNKMDIVMPSETVKVKAMIWNSKQEMLPIGKEAVLIP